MEEVTDEEIRELEQELKKLEDKNINYPTSRTKLNNIQKAYLNAIIAILLKKDINYLDKLYRKIKGNI